MPKIRLDDLIKYQGDNEIVKKVVKKIKMVNNNEIINKNDKRTNFQKQR